ncbi:halomucin [Ditylenchus destructor]|nr:halomucin [Ditylenchus destructor]
MSLPLPIIVNIFDFLDRKDLGIMSTTNKFMNRIVREHFPSKPYRLLNDVRLEICRDENELIITLFSEKYIEGESSENHGWKDGLETSMGLESGWMIVFRNQCGGWACSHWIKAGSEDFQKNQDAEDGSSESQDAEDESSENQDAMDESSENQDAEDGSSENQDAMDESSGSQDSEDESSERQNAKKQFSIRLYFNPDRNEWLKENCYFPLETMRPYLSQFVRVDEAILFCDEYSYTPEDMTMLASISHLWSGRLLWLSVRDIGIESQPELEMNFRNNVSSSIHNILSNEAIFSSRYLELYEFSQFVSLHDYSRVYTLDMLLLKIYICPIPLNIEVLLALIEHKSQFPESKTLFVLDISTFETREAEVTDAIRKNFSSASTTCPFQLVIMDDDNSEGSDEFRLENGTTREVLQLKIIKKDSSIATKILELPCDYETEKFILIERSRF